MCRLVKKSGTYAGIFHADAFRIVGNVLYDLERQFADVLFVAGTVNHSCCGNGQF